MKNIVLVVLLLLPIVGESLDKRNVLKTIESEDGDIIDCVDFYDQPAFNDPMIKNLTIQIIAEQKIEVYMMANSSTPPPIQQTWQRSGSCPKGTIPILRMEEKDTILTSSIAGDPGAHLEVAIAYDKVGPFQGTSGNVVVWRPYVQSNEYSANIVACASGGFPQSVTNVLAVGWTVNPALFGDYNPRSIIAVTNDNNMILWCYNLKCPAFIQTNPNVVLGATLESSVYGDPNKQVAMIVSIYKDEAHQVWRVAFNHVDIGFIPIQDFANLVQCDTTLWGGLVYNSQISPTRTQMGNGYFSNNGDTKTGGILDILVNINGSFVVRERMSGYQVTRPSCYDIRGFVSGLPQRSPGNNVRYGGPGANSVYCT